MSGVFWIGDYIKFNALKAKKDKGGQTGTSASEKVSRNALVLTAPSFMVQPISGLLIGVTNMSNEDANTIGQYGLAETWCFDIGYLKDLAKSLWDTATEKQWKILEMGISYNDLFPYRTKDGLLLPSSCNPISHID
jgi:hypothetical protein